MSEYLHGHVPGSVRCEVKGRCDGLYLGGCSYWSVVAVE